MGGVNNTENYAKTMKFGYEKNGSVKVTKPLVQGGIVRALLIKNGLDKANSIKKIAVYYLPGP